MCNQATNSSQMASSKEALLKVKRHDDLQRPGNQKLTFWDFEEQWTNQKNQKGSLRLDGPLNSFSALAYQNSVAFCSPAKVELLVVYWKTH